MAAVALSVALWLVFGYVILKAVKVGAVRAPLVWPAVVFRRNNAPVLFVLCVGFYAAIPLVMTIGLLLPAIVP